MFDNIDHELLMKAGRIHVKEPWIVLYIERWLKAPFEDAEHNVTERLAGTPQGGVISPLLANLFMHYTFDKWMGINYPYCLFKRYAYDTVIHCRSEAQVKFILDKVRSRMEACKLELHPIKTKIVYCQDKDSRKQYGCTQFDFLGYTYQKVFNQGQNREAAVQFTGIRQQEGNQIIKCKHSGDGDTQENRSKN